MSTVNQLIKFVVWAIAILLTYRVSEYWQMTVQLFPICAGLATVLMFVIINADTDNPETQNRIEASAAILFCATLVYLIIVVGAAVIGGPSDSFYKALPGVGSLIISLAVSACAGATAGATYCLFQGKR